MVLNDTAMKKAVTRSWDRSSETYDTCPGHLISSPDEKDAWAQERSRILPRTCLNILDVGCGTGVMGEPRGPNHLNYVMNVGRQGEYAPIAASTHYGRADAFCIDPRIKIAFADPSMKFDFTEPRKGLPAGRSGSSRLRASGRWSCRHDNGEQRGSYLNAGI
jgi:hypothetical protein